MKELIKKILREEDFQWMIPHSIDGFELREHIISMNLKTIKGFTKVDGNLDLYTIGIESLGDIEEVTGHLNLERTSIKDLGNLKRVGDNLFLEGTPFSQKYSEEEIREMVDVKGVIFV